MVPPCYLLFEADSSLARSEEEGRSMLEDLNQALLSSPVLTSPDFSLPFKVQTDASNVGLGAILTQGHEDGEHVVATRPDYCRGQNNTIWNPKEECLAVDWAVEKWREYLEGTPFIVVTDHAALTCVFNQPKPYSRLTRWVLCLQTFDFTIQYRKVSVISYLTLYHAVWAHPLAVIHSQFSDKVGEITFTRAAFYYRLILNLYLG